VASRSIFSLFSPDEEVFANSLRTRPANHVLDAVCRL
jgi:hypothetical protein